jgi:HSP20 family protein
MCTNAPAINVKENDRGYKIELAVPGMTKDDFKIHINKDGNLVVEMEKKKEEKCGTEEKKECKYLRQEFCYCKFHQTLALPENVDRENIEAYVKDGVLKIKVPKLQTARLEEENRVIEVK